MAASCASSSLYVPEVEVEQAILRALGNDAFSHLLDLGTGKERVFEKFGEEIAKKVLAIEVKNEDLAEAEYRETVKIEGEELSLSLKRA